MEYIPSVGDIVTVDVKSEMGKEFLVEGRITKENPDGTFSVKLDSDLFEHQVHKSRIKNLGQI